MTTADWIQICAALTAINFVSGLFILFLAVEFYTKKKYNVFNVLMMFVGAANMLVSGFAFNFLIKHLEIL